MSGASLKLKSLYNNLSKTERSLADFILANIERMPFLSVYEMAEAAHVSVATVSRLVRKVGYGNLKNFKVEIARDTASPNNYFYQQIKPSDSEDTLIDKVFLGNIKSLQDTLKILNKKLYTLGGFFIGETHYILASIPKISSDYFLFGCLLCDIIIGYGKTTAIHSHIGRRFVE